MALFNRTAIIAFCVPRPTVPFKLSMDLTWPSTRKCPSWWRTAAIIREPFQLAYLICARYVITRQGSITQWIWKGKNIFLNLRLWPCSRPIQPAWINRGSSWILARCQTEAPSKTPRTLHQLSQLPERKTSCQPLTNIHSAAPSQRSTYLPTGMPPFPRLAIRENISPLRGRSISYLLRRSNCATS